jgi:2-amino-4-hydroxy-6-hydroxymethyldihydropteridine diphosphokinase
MHHGRVRTPDEDLAPDPRDGRELAAIGLGANVGAARRTLVEAVAALAALPRASLQDVSRLYRTRPVGPVAQADFWNAALTLRVPGAPSPAEGALALLQELKVLERDFGRQARQRWGPRELDLDLLLFGGHRLRLERPPAARSADPGRSGIQWLEVPHPLAVERLFVLAPLADLLPHAWPPGWRASVADALAAVREREGPGAVRAVASWDPASRTWRDDREPSTVSD